MNIQFRRREKKKGIENRLPQRELYHKVNSPSERRKKEGKKKDTSNSLKVILVSAKLLRSVSTWETDGHTTIVTTEKGKAKKGVVLPSKSNANLKSNKERRRKKNHSSYNGRAKTIIKLNVCCNRRLLEEKKEKNMFLQPNAESSQVRCL